jgi:hypothetical protein
MSYLHRMPKLSVLASVRLANIAGIMAAGFVLGKSHKDNEVLEKELQASFSAPLHYDHASRIRVRVTIEDLAESTRFFIYTVRFEIGEHAEHKGTARCYYCKWKES